MKIPNDPFILLSWINTKLRDYHPSLDDLCLSLGIEKTEILEKLEKSGFRYNQDQNRFEWKVKIMKKRIFSLIFSLLFVFLMLPVQTQASTTKNISQTGINFIEAFEGFSKYAYWDHKQYTIGYGTKCEKNEYPNGITEKKAQELLTKTLPSYEGYVNTFLSKHKIKITQNQFDALVSFTYNFGNVWSSSNDFTLRTYLIKGISKYSNKEITKSFTNWSNAGGVRSEGLFNRRKAEAKLFLSKDPVPGEETWVVKESVSIRKSPSTTASKIGEFARGSVLKVVSKNQIGKMLWGEIVYKDSAAWVCLEYSEYSKLNFTSSNSLWKPIVLKIENDLSGIKITWEKVNNSKSYQVLRKSDSSKFSVIGTTNSSTTSFTDTKVSQNKKYTYSIKAIGEKKSSDYNQKGYSLTHLKAVSTLKAVVKNKAISLSWKKQSNATGYQIFKKVGNGEFESLTEVGNSSSFTDKKISPNQTYTYLIKAFNSSAVSGYNEKQATAFYLAAPKINGANTASGIKLSFKKVELAKEYILYRKDSQDSAYKKYKTLKTTSLLDKNVSENILYSYKLKIVKDKTFSDYGEEFAAEFVKNPKLIGIINEKKVCKFLGKLLIL